MSMKEEKGDLISREALKKAITEHCRSEAECLNHFWYDENIIALIDNAPTVEAVPLEHHNKIKGILDNEVKSLVDILDKERPQGEWIVKTKSTFPQYQPDEYQCSFCKTIVTFKTDFCPNCGAKMKGGAE